MNYVKATTRTTLLLDYLYLPIEIVRARDTFTAMMRKKIHFFDGQKSSKVPFTVLDVEMNDYDGDSWIRERDRLLAKEIYPVLRTGQHAYPVPTILKVNSVFKKPPEYRMLKKPSFQELLEKHNYTCGITGKRFDPKEFNPYEVFNKDHVIPKSKGGTDTEENIILALKEANSKKDDMYPYLNHAGEELKAVIQNNFFPKLKLKGVKYRTEWGSLLFKDQ